MDNELNKLGEVYARKPKIELYRDNFQNYRRYGIPKAQLVIADIPSASYGRVQRRTDLVLH